MKREAWVWSVVLLAFCLSLAACASAPLAARDPPMEFRLGMHHVIRGWEHGIPGMPPVAGGCW